MRYNHCIQFWGVLVLLLVLNVQFAVAQTYSVKYNDQSVELVIRDLRKRTGYEFVYQKQVIEEAPHITGYFKDMTLQQLLNRIFLNEASIDYEIVKQTIVLKKMNPDDDFYFKSNVTGMVTDENDEPLVGVSVMQRSTKNGVATDVDGAFSLLVEGKNPSVEVSYVGYKKKNVTINRKMPFFVVKLQPDETILDEVLVTGFQNIKRESAVGAYQTIHSKDLDDYFTNDVASRLEGKVPGLVSYNNGNGKNGEDALVIRGAGSFNARTSPLVVVDGLPIEGSLETVNSYDIETINVLKDASAASIYGARASNGVIVITTKRAHKDRISVDFNADLTISENQSYSNRRWANASQYLDVEEANFNYVSNDANLYNGLLGQYNARPSALSPAARLMLRHKLGEVSDAHYAATMNQWRQNDYRREWQDAMERQQIQHQYHLAFRTQGKRINSNIVLNYTDDNLGRVNESKNSFRASYNGEMDVTKWLDLSFGVNLISERSKTHASGANLYNDINSFAPYMSMRNADGSVAAMEAATYLGEESLGNSSLGLKDESYNLLNETNLNFSRERRNNIRSYVHASFHILPELVLSTKFQYEDIIYKDETYLEGQSYYMRHLYNLATSDGVHHLPEGGMLSTNNQNGDYYTFRVQGNYARTFAEKHAVEAIVGFEYRQTHNRYAKNVLLGYDDQTQTNMNHLINFYDLNQLQSSDLGTSYSPAGALPSEEDFKTQDVLHRFYSLYANANYTYDSRYAAQFSYRVDKTDLFGADPKYRGRPLWSAGASWNLQNEDFMKGLKWIDVLKLRASYGLTGNIDQSVSSYLTAAIAVNDINSSKGATLNTPPNDQLRWEKTASWNVGVDFSFIGNRLSGGIDWYYKKSTDLLSLTDIDPTTGWTSLTINNGKARNTGVELQLNGVILDARTTNDVGLNVSLGIAHNSNKILKVDHAASSGYEALNTMHQGDPINALYSYRFAGMQTDESGVQAYGWYDAKGNVHATDVQNGEFTTADVVYSGSLDPKINITFSPEITWKGFSLSAMFAYYGGHVMRAAMEDWTYGGSQYGYGNLEEPMPSAFANYWTATDKNTGIANGCTSLSTIGNPYYIDQTVVKADFMKLRYIVLGYNFPKKMCKKLGIGSMRLRAQMNNVAKWVRNDLGIDPEAVDPYSGYAIAKPRKSYVMSLSVNF